MTLNLSEQRKVKVPRETFVKWLEEAMQHLCESQIHTREVARTFSKCGLDPYDDEKVLLEKHMENMSACKLYESLLRYQTAATLD